MQDAHFKEARRGKQQQAFEANQITDNFVNNLIDPNNEDFTQNTMIIDNRKTCI